MSAPTPGGPAGVDAPTVDGEPSPLPSASRFPGLVVRGVLGQGGGGVVYRAWDGERGEEVALKALGGGGWATPAQRARFRREVSALRALDDPGVVEVYDDGVAADGTPWFTMRLVEGSSLADVLAGPSPPPLPERVRKVEDVARTLGRLHARGVVHRDVKPSNVLVDPAGRSVLGDFGLVLGPDDERVTRATRAVGTPRYMAPELASGEVADWPRADVHALGVMLRDALGEGPPARLRRIADRATARDPKDRYATASGLADDLARWRDGRWIGTSAVAWTVRARLRAARAPLLAVGAVAAGLGAVWGSASWRAHAREDAADEAWSAARADVLTLWGAGRADDAVARFGAFADDPGRAGTRAVATAWLERAALHRAAGEADAEILAEQTALQAAPDDDLRRQAVAALVASYRAYGRWAPLADLLAALPAGVDASDVADLGEARVEAALATGDVRGALDGLSPADAALVAPLAAAAPIEGLPVGWVAGEPVRIDPSVRAPTFEDGWRLPVHARLSGTLVVWHARADGHEAHVGRLDGDRYVALFDGPAPPLGAIASADGRVFVAGAGMERRVFEIVGGRLRDADPLAAALDSRAEGLAAGDLDGDGHDELVAVYGGISAYAVRSWKLVAGGLEPMATHRIGPADLIGVLPTSRGARILVARRPVTPKDVPFDGGDAFAGTCALVALSSPSVVAQEIRFGSGETRCPPVDGVLADVDGDGLVDVAAGRKGAPGELWLYRQQADGSLAAPLRIGGLEPVQAVPGAEGSGGARGDGLLVLHEEPDGGRTAWLAGAGGDVVPKLAVPSAAPPSSDPLPEPTDPLDNTVAWSVQGQPGEWLGGGVTGVGDVDGDGFADVLVAASPWGGARGRVHLYRGSPGGLEAVPATTLTGDPGDRLGGTVAALGDVDGDGYDDVALAAPDADGGRGRALVARGGPGGLGAPEVLVRGVAAWAWSPLGVAAAGDLDRDGYDDVLVTRVAADGGWDALWYRGGRLGLASAPARTWRAGPGTAVLYAAGVGDLDGDGFDDMVLGAEGVGRVTWYRGGPGGPGERPAGALKLPGSGWSFGSRLARAGDVDGDGYGDVLVGAWGADAERGLVGLWRGGSSGPSERPALVLEGSVPEERFGAALAGVGDIDGDGHADVAVGGYGFSRRKGRVALYHGARGGLDPMPARVHTAPVQSDYGGGVGGAGDVDGDGYDDWLVGAPLAAGDFRGQALLFLGHDDRDSDGDGFVDDVDCADDDPAVNPSATEICDGKDDDCEGLADDAEPAPPADATPWFEDADGDGKGDASTRRLLCVGPKGWVAVGGDPDDADPKR